MLLLIAGPSTSGKDSVWLRAAEGLGFAREVPLTTRARRASEKEGRDYEFVDVAVFQRLVAVMAHILLPRAGTWKSPPPLTRGVACV